MKIGIIIETKEYEKAWNAMRFAVTARKNNHEVTAFLMGEGVEIVDIHHEQFDIQTQIKAFLELNGTFLACGTCLKSRNMDGSESCPLSTMTDCLQMVEWADKVLTF
ncbi:DsrE family protein [bacterium]|nr:DsrE family protein [bacterium]